MLEKLRERLQSRALNLRKLASSIDAAGNKNEHDASLATTLRRHADELKTPIESVEAVLIAGVEGADVAEVQRVAQEALQTAEKEAKYASGRLRALGKK